MKQTYKKADAEVILFNNSDVVTTSGETVSGETNNCGNTPNNWDHMCTGWLDFDLGGSGYAE